MKHLASFKDEGGGELKKKKKIEVWISVQTKDQILSSQMYKKNSENTDSYQEIFNSNKLKHTHTEKKVITCKEVVNSKEKKWATFSPSKC